MIDTLNNYMEVNRLSWPAFWTENWDKCDSASLTLITAIAGDQTDWDLNIMC